MKELMFTRSLASRLPLQPILSLTVWRFEILRTFGNQGAALWLGMALAFGGVPGANAREWTGYVSVKDFGAQCDGITDDGLAIQKAVDAALRIHFPAGICFLNSTVRLRAGTILRGEGMGVSVVKQGRVSGSSMGTFYADSGTATSKLAGIQITEMTIYGQSDVSGFSEFQHLVSFNGVKNALVEKVEFKGFRGDGLYIGSGSNGADERHNENIIVRRSVFDGVNNSNRNGISIIDGDTVLIDGNTFRNTTQSNMPGAIDVEPDWHPFHVIKNITVSNNVFSGINGNAAISFYFNSAIVTTPTGFRIEGNSVSGIAGGISFITRVKPITTSTPHHLIVANNAITTLGRSLVIRGAKEFKVFRNVFSGSAGSSFIGYTDETDKCMNGEIADNEFRNISGIGLTVFSIDHLAILRNQFIDIGSGVPGSYAIDFNAGISSYVAMVENIISAPTGKTAFAIQKEAGHTFTPNTNTIENNKFIGVSGNAFQATTP